MSKQAVQAYFDRKAPDYDRRSASGLWRKVREREWKAVRSLLGELTGVSAVDLGCGSGFYSERLAREGARLLAVDCSARMVACLERKGIPAVQSDIEKLRLPGIYSLLLSAGSIEFVGSASAFFSSCSGMAEDSTRLVMLAPRAGAVGQLYRIFHALQGCPVRVRSRRELIAAAAQNGWHLQALRGAGPLAIAMRFGRTGQP